MAAHPQAPHLSKQSQFPISPPRFFAHSSQHLDLVCHDHCPALPLQPKVGLLEQTLPCESSRPRFGSGVASDRSDSSGAGGTWGRMPAAKTTGSQCDGQATPEATLEVTPDEPSTMLVRRSTLITAPTRAKARRTMCVCVCVCVSECARVEGGGVTDAHPLLSGIQLQICTPCNRPGNWDVTVFSTQWFVCSAQPSHRQLTRGVLLHSG